jgi:Zn-dependent peptidase ImmA (M78 family)
MVDIEHSVQRLIKKFGTSNPVELCKQCDYAIVPASLPEGTLGQTVRSNRCATIFVDIKLPSTTQLFVIAHELGHCRLHKDYDTPFMREHMNGGYIPEIEREANEFAFKLLLSELDDGDQYNKYDMPNYFGLPDYMARYIK